MKKLLISILAALALPVLGADYAKFGTVTSELQTTYTNRVSTSGGAIPAGTNWVYVTAAPAFGARGWMGMLDFNGSMWVIGGLKSPGATAIDDIWYSSDGAVWTQATASGGWGGRNSFRTVVYDNKMWMMGGWGMNDVWYSSNGTNWTQATAAAAWSARRDFALVVFNGSMWLLGGDASSTSQNDVWWSTDGVTWTAAPNAAWAERQQMGYCVYDNKIWIAGGYSSTLGDRTQDVWSSVDGTNWVQATAAAAWGLRIAWTSTSMPVHDNKMFFFGNNMTGGAQTNDLWASTDGATWTLTTPTAGWSGAAPRIGNAFTAMKGKLWLLGGATGYVGTKYADIYSSQSGEYVFDVVASPSGQSMGATLLPAADNTYDLGSPAIRWRHGYFAETSLFVGTQAVSQAAVGNWNQNTQTVATLPTNDWNAATAWTAANSNSVLKANGSVAWTGPQNAGNQILTNLAGFWLGGVLVTNMDTNAVSSLESDVAGLTSRTTALEGQTNAWNTATTYNNAANQTNALLSFTFTFQDPTNGLVYWNANPYATRSCTLMSAFVKSHGMTGTVDLLRQHRSSAWYTYDSLTNGVALNTTGTEQTAFYGSAAITNGVRLGVMFNNLSAFAWTNMATVDITVRYP